MLSLSRPLALFLLRPWQPIYTFLVEGTGILTADFDRICTLGSRSPRFYVNAMLLFFSTTDVSFTGDVRCSRVDEL